MQRLLASLDSRLSERGRQHDYICGMLRPFDLHPLQASLNRGFTKGLSATFNYADSRDLVNATALQNPLRWQLEWAQGAIAVPPKRLVQPQLVAAVRQRLRVHAEEQQANEAAFGGWQLSVIGLS